MKVRHYETHDFESLYALEKRVFQDAWSKSTMEKELSNFKAHYFVAEENGVVLGYAGFWLVVDEAELMKIAVDVPYRRRGLAGALLVAVLDEARQQGAACLLLEVRETNEAARALYEKYGFHAYSIRKQYYSDGENAVLYKRKLEEDGV